MKVTLTAFIKKIRTKKNTKLNVYVYVSYLLHFTAVSHISWPICQYRQASSPVTNTNVTLVLRYCCYGLSVFENDYDASGTIGHHDIKTSARNEYRHMETF